MTEDLEPTTASEDELVSAVLDGEATEAERAAVESDPRLSARLQTFARVRARLPTGEVDASSRDRAVGAALAEAGRATSTEGAGRGGAPVELAQWRERGPRNAATIVAVAAAVIVIVPLLAVTLFGRASETNLASSDSAGEAASQTSIDPTGQALTGTDPVDAGDFGELSATSELRAKVRDVLDRPSAAPSESPSTSPSTTAAERSALDDAGRAADRTGELGCASVLGGAEPALGDVVLTATTTWVDEPSFVLVFRRPSPGDPLDPSGRPNEVIMVVRADCTVIERVTT